MSTVRVDDEDSNVFTNGEWSVSHGDAMAYKGGVSVSYADGSSKVTRFRGTSIDVIGFVLLNNDSNPLPANQKQVMQFSIDGGTRTHAPNPNPTDYGRGAYLPYYRSGQLPIGEHVLTMVTMAVDGVLVLDEFVIHATGGTAQILQSDGSPTPSKSGPSPSSVTSPSNAPSVTHTTQSSGVSSATSNLPSSSNNTSVSSTGSSSIPASSSGSTGNDPLSTSASSVFSASIYNPTTINANGHTIQGDDKSSHKTRVIIASVVPSVLLLIIMFGIIILLKRRRQRANSQPTDPFPPNSSGVAMAQTLPPDKLIGVPSETSTNTLTTLSTFTSRYTKQRMRQPNQVLVEPPNNIPVESPNEILVEPPPYAV